MPYELYIYTYELYTYTNDEQTLMFLGPIVNVERHYSNGAITHFEHVDGDVFYEMHTSDGREIGKGQILSGFDLESNHFRSDIDDFRVAMAYYARPLEAESDIERDRR